MPSNPKSRCVGRLPIMVASIVTAIAAPPSVLSLRRIRLKAASAKPAISTK